MHESLVSLHSSLFFFFFFNKVQENGFRVQVHSEFCFAEFHDRPTGRGFNEGYDVHVQGVLSTASPMAEPLTWFFVSVDKMLISIPVKLSVRKDTLQRFAES